MIYFIVGKPRIGKTYFLVEKLIDRIKKQKGDDFKLVSNIRNHSEADSIINFQTDITNPDYDNSVIVLDEIQFYSLRDAKGNLFLHFTTHGHQGRDYYWITQSVDAIPRKWRHLVERTIKIESIAGSQYAKAFTYLGVPTLKESPISSETFLPKKSERYNSTEDGAQVSKRRTPMKVWYMLAGAFSCLFVAPFYSYKLYQHYFSDNTILVEEKDSTQFSLLTADKALEIKASIGSPSNDPYTLTESPAIDPYPLEDGYTYLLGEVAGDAPSMYTGCDNKYFSDRKIFVDHCENASKSSQSYDSEQNQISAVEVLLHAMEKPDIQKHKFSHIENGNYVYTDSL